jgi:hypothetical protein
MRKEFCAGVSQSQVKPAAFTFHTVGLTSTQG